MAEQMDDMQAVAAWRRQEAERIERNRQAATAWRRQEAEWIEHNRQAGAEWDNQQPMQKHELVFCLSIMMNEDQSENFRGKTI